MRGFNAASREKGNIKPIFIVTFGLSIMVTIGQERDLTMSHRVLSAGSLVTSRTIEPDEEESDEDSSEIYLAGAMTRIHT